MSKPIQAVSSTKSSKQIEGQTQHTCGMFFDARTAKRHFKKKGDVKEEDE